MSSTQPNLDALAREVVTVLCTSAFVLIRALARVVEREDRPVFHPEHPEISASEWIRQLADRCHNLPGSLSASAATGPVEAIRSMWHTSNAVQREWMEDALTSHGINLADLIDLTR